MTVKFEQIERNEKSAYNSWAHFDKSIDLLGNDGQIIRHVLTSAIRAIMRDEQCSRIPKVIAAYWGPVDRWGNNMKVEVEYTRYMQWRAVYAGHIESDGNFKWQCYMD